MSTTDPNSPTARAKARPAPASMAGARPGRTTRHSTWRGEAPREAAASSVSASSSASTGWTAADAEGQRHEGQGEKDAEAGAGHVHVEGAVGAVEGEQGQAGHHGGQGEREVDERTEEGLAPEVVAHEHAGDDQPGDRVDDGDDGRGTRVSSSAATASGWVTPSKRPTTPH